MPSSFRDPKSLADWIQLDYFRKAGRFWRVRNRLTWSMLLAACLVMVALTWWPRARFIYESRPVSSAHAMFNDNCAVCHIETFQPVTRFVRVDSNVRSVADATCRSCHDGPPHHGKDPHCSICHPEHRGRPVLARVADNQCTVCHADLNAVGGSPNGFATTISGFPTKHPPFGAWQHGVTDPGTIRFNHKVHLNLTPESVRGIDNPLVTLKDQQQRCIYCHQVDERPDAAGRYMKPIHYDQHCSQCHALSVGIAGTWQEEKVQLAAERFGREPAPHKEPLTVRAALRERFTRFVQDNPAAVGAQESAEPPRWIFGGPRAQPANDKEWLWVNDQLRTAERTLFDGANGCGSCHAAESVRGPGELPRYRLSQIKPVWFAHSRFSHERHRMLRCTECHAAAASSKTKDVLLPKIEECQKCHNSEVGARTDCAECHRYHNRAKEVFRGQKVISDYLHKS